MEKTYICLRHFLGILGMALAPLVLIFGSFGNNGLGWYFSISASAYTNAAPIFHGTMGAVGCFLIAYGIASLSVKGYSRLDCIVNFAAGVFAWLIALFPCMTALVDRAGLYPLPIHASALIHNISAAAFFLLRAFNIVFLFTKTRTNPTPQKLKRNRIYRVCGVGIAFFMACQVVTSVLAFDGPYTMVNEVGMLLFDGVSWMVKGEALLRDKTEA